MLTLIVIGLVGGLITGITIHQPIEEIGRTAVRVIVGVISGDDVAGRPVELSTRLVIRDPPHQPLNWPTSEPKMTR